MSAVPHHKLSDAQQRNHEKLRRECGSVFLQALDDPRTIEIILNPDGRLWQERLGEEMRCIGTMAASQAEAMLRTVAAYLDTTISRDNPLLEGEFPLDSSRFSGLLPPIVTAPAFALRKKASAIFTLEQYVEHGIMSDQQYEVICSAVTHRKNIVISGGTGSGKTTLTNAVIHQMVVDDPGCRFIIIEDTGEIQCSAQNYLQLHTFRALNIMELVRRSLRLRPDRILVGEVRNEEALDLLMAWNTGHAGGVATVHANNAFATLSRLHMLVGMNRGRAPDPIEPLIGEAVDLIIHIGKTEGGKRKVQEILAVSHYDIETNSYITQSL